MTYSVKAQIAQFAFIEVSGDEVAIIVALLNDVTRKFFPMYPASKVEI